MKKSVFIFLVSITCYINIFADTSSGNYKTSTVFVKEAFQQKPPQVSVIWIRGDIKKKVAEILGHKYPKLRIKYWKQDARTVWVLEEIGKEKPITTGIIINNNRISKVEILAFRESRGWEVKYPFFLKQFVNAGLKGNNRLDQNIDGITGATLSVRAVSKLSRIALLLHKYETRRAQAPQTARK